MEFDELKKLSRRKILLRAKSGRGKTRLCSIVALNVARAGARVLYVDTEAEGSTTMVEMVEDPDTDFEPDDVGNVEYVQAQSYEELMDAIDKDGPNQGKFDLIVVDTLDHKHSYTLKHVTDAKLESDADWNQYPHIYSAEKQLMEQIGKPTTNFICTLDPDSGSMDKPKGAQTNVHGYFDIVLELIKNNDGWDNKIRNWVNHGDKIGMKHPDVEGKLTEVVLERTDADSDIEVKVDA
jgi:RecA/RadA recombinase